VGALKVLNSRVATQAEADARSVVFYIPEGRSVPYSFGRDLPLQAKVVIHDEANGYPFGSMVTVVQAEQGDNGEIVLGLMFGEDQEGICMLSDVEIIDLSIGSTD
jgi:hypothetical protein